jgi:DNA-binding transcriptional LysR family regulator
MKIDHLKSFHRVAVTGSFTHAARDLFLTQPAVSQQIQLLEHRLGTKLFDRLGKGVGLTSEGEVLFSYTARLFQIYDEIEMLFGQLRDLETGRITIGSTAVIGTYFLPQIIGGYNKKYPGIDIDMRMGNSYAVLNMLISGQVDLGFAGRLKIDPRLNSVLVHREKLLLVSSPDNPLTERATVSVDELCKIPFIWREKGTQTRALVKKWFEHKMGRNYPKKSIELQNLEAAKRTVVEGYGLTIIPEISVRRELHVGLLKRINLNGFDLSFDYYLFYKKGKIFSKAAETFLEMMAGFHLLSHPEYLKAHLSIKK